MTEIVEILIAMAIVYVGGLPIVRIFENYKKDENK